MPMHPTASLRLLVTGGLGFIGSTFIRHVLQHHPRWSVVNLDLQTYAGNPNNLRDCDSSPQYRWVRGDIADAAVVGPLMSAADVVVHCAAETHVDRSILDAQRFLQTNVIGTHVLLEAARKSSVQLFLHISTDEVYGSVVSGESHESDALQPRSPYAASKAASDLLVRAYQETYGVPAIISRCSNNFGPYQYPEKALPLLITNALEGKPFPLYGDGRHVRDWLYVADHVRALIVLITKGTPGEIYNIGGTCSIQNRELFPLVLDLMKKPQSLLIPVADRLGHDRRYALNCAHIRALGWSPRVEFASAIRDTITWYEAHEQWWRPLKEDGEFKKYHDRQYESRFAEVSR